MKVSQIAELAYQTSILTKSGTNGAKLYSVWRNS